LESLSTENVDAKNGLFLKNDLIVAGSACGS
jgi:hypothetical protein